jgi:glycosyltransferase involved in cell wall biosynthesis
MDPSKTSPSSGLTSVAMLGTLPPLRGLSSYCLELALAMANRAQVEFISIKKLYPEFLYPGGRLKEDHSFPDVNHERLKISRNLTWYNPLTWVREALFTGADLLHAQWWSLPLVLIYACLCAVFKMRGKPVVFTVHNVLDHGHSPLFKAASRWLFKLGDHFIVHTEEGCRQMQTHYAIPADRISVISHGSLDFHVKQQVNRADIRQELNIDPRHKVVLLFGAIRPYKGIETAIEAFSQVLLEVPDSLLIIAGKLWQRWEPYQQLIDKHGIAKEVRTFLNYIPSNNVFRYFEAADLVILPYLQFSSQSGVGGTAVSFRKPMIVSAVGGLPDLVKNTEYIVPPGNPDLLARKMIDCLSDPTRLAAMAADAQQVAAEISWPVIAQKTLAIYERMLNPKDLK